MAYPTNTKSFNLTNRISKTYSIFLKGFQYATSLFFSMGIKIPILFSGSVIAKILLAVTVKRVRLLFTNVKLTVRNIQSLNIKRIRVIVSAKEVGKIISTITSRLRITAESKAIQKATTLLRLRSIYVEINPTVASFYTLGDFDGSTLATLDPQDLLDLDYSTA